MLGPKKIYLCVAKNMHGTKIYGAKLSGSFRPPIGKGGTTNSSICGKAAQSGRHTKILTMFLWNYLSAQSCQDTVTPFLILCAIKSLCNCKISINQCAQPINSICASAPLKIISLHQSCVAPSTMESPPAPPELEHPLPPPPRMDGESAARLLQRWYRGVARRRRFMVIINRARRRRKYLEERRRIAQRVYTTEAWSQFFSP